jgi:sec-independent protein translocase protein TatA
MLRNFGPTEIIIIAVLIIVIFGWKKLPDAARSLGRSARVFKSEVDEMKKENEASKSGASSETVRGESITQERSTEDPVARDTTGEPTREGAPRTDSSGPAS